MVGVIKVRFRNADSREDVDVLIFRYAFFAHPYSQHVLSKAQKLVYIDFAASHPNSSIVNELFNDIKREWVEFKQSGFVS